MIKLSKFKACCWRQRVSERGTRTAWVVAFLAMMTVPGSSCATGTAHANPVILTDQQPQASLAINSQQIASRPSTLEIDVTDLSNPELVPIGVAIYMVSGDLKALVGSFAFYPADHKGNFFLDCKAAVAQIGRAQTGRAQNVQLLFELRKLRSSAAWKPVRVTIATPKWR